MNLPLTSSSSPAQHKLEQALANFHCILTPEELSNLPVTSPDALSMVKLTAEIDAKGKNRTLRRCGSYFDSLLESIMLYSGVADTLVSSNPQIAALVWGSVKIVILAAHNLSRAFETLAEMFQTIGSLSPVLEKFQELFPESRSLRESLIEYYALVVQFCTEALTFLKKPCKYLPWIGYYLFFGVDVL
ncbi:hypothetical protein Q9L58_008115 [Maublancomyces gigas]|uniref:DUF7708 domain-containing protein n=1 Tax=Discina gigas TaxID=1032678 RepID=A0ABR3GAM4_9PEZI